MNADYITIGPVPGEEDCAQVGEPDFRKQATKEVDAFIDMLYRLFPDALDHNVIFKPKWQRHDFGSYVEAAILFYYEDEDSTSYAYNVERNVPAFWDDIAKEMLDND